LAIPLDACMFTRGSPPPWRPVHPVARFGLTRLTEVMVAHLAEILELDPRWVTSHFTQYVSHTGHLYIVSLMALCSRGISAKSGDFFTRSPVPLGVSGMSVPNLALALCPSIPYYQAPHAEKEQSVRQQNRSWWTQRSLICSDTMTPPTRA